MISFSSQGISALETTEKFSHIDFNIQKILENIHQKKQGFYSDEVLENEALCQEIDEFVLGHSNKKFLIILGIGGSSLGGIALQKMLSPHSENNVFFLDTMDPEKIYEVSEKIHIKSTLFLVMSKSGGTVEVLSQYAIFLKKVLDNSLEISEHFAFVTGKTGFLREEGEQRNVKMFPVPENVGGRFSVLTAIGLLPARFMGINIRELLEGARDMRTKFLEKNPEKNTPLQFANIQYNALQQGINKNVMYAYSNFLFPLADWFRQLLAESTGKRYSQNGKEIFTGITPINAMGVTDHHSQNQLYMEGPFDTLICFLEIDRFSPDIEIPDLGYTQSPLSFLQGKKISEVLIAERDASKQALTECNRPWIQISVPEINAKHVGELFLFFEASTAILGEMMNINVFDQPGVERTKIITKELLQK